MLNCQLQKQPPYLEQTNNDTESGWNRSLNAGAEETIQNKTNALINVNLVGGGGNCGQGVGIWQSLKFLDQIPQGGKRKVEQKCQKSPHPGGKNLNKQYYDTI